MSHVPYASVVGRLMYYMVLLWPQPTPIRFWLSQEKYNGYPTKLWGYTTISYYFTDSYTSYMASMFGLGVFWDTAIGFIPRTKGWDLDLTWNYESLKLIFTWWIEYWSIERWSMNFHELDFIDWYLWLVDESLNCEGCFPKGSYPWFPLIPFYSLIMFFSFNHIVLTLLFLSLLTTYKFYMIGFEDMVNQKWLDDKGAFGEAFQILSWDQEDMRNYKLHPRVIILVNQSGFNHHLCVFSMNPYEPQWRGWSWPMNERY